MTTSGSFTFSPTFANILDEAIERAGIDPRSVVADHIQSAKMSLNLLLTEWSARDGDNVTLTSEGTATVISGTNYFTLATGSFDIIAEDIVFTYDGADEQLRIGRISREDYLLIPDKTVTGRPTQFYVDQSLDVASVEPLVYLYPVPDATCVFTYDAMRWPQTVTALGETLDLKRPWFEAMAAGLALRLAKKYNVARVPMLIGDAEQSYRYARRAGAGNSQITVSVRGFGHPGRTARR